MDNYQLFNENLKRVESIVSLYEKIDEYVDDDKTSKKSDLLRASVVLLHSSFENYFRETIKNVAINTSNNEIIKELLSIVKKIELEELIKRKDDGIKLNEYIIELIEKRMLLSSFNSVGEISNYLNIIRIDSKFEHKKEIEELIARRHKIVHEADKNINENGNRLKQINKKWFDERKTYIIELVKYINDAIMKGVQ